MSEQFVVEKEWFENQADVFKRLRCKIVNDIDYIYLYPVDSIANKAISLYKRYESDPLTDNGMRLLDRSINDMCTAVTILHHILCKNGNVNKVALLDRYLLSGEI